MLYFTWCDQDTPFTPNDLQNDLDLFDINLVHKEGFPCVLTVVTWAKNINELLHDRQNSWCFLSHINKEKEITCLFHGMYVGLEKIHEKYFISLAFKAEKNNQSSIFDLTKNFLQSRDDGSYDPILCVKDDNQRESLLACTPHVPYWNRMGGNIALSHALKGNATATISSQDFDPSSLTIASKNPLTGIKIQASAQWMQCLTGYKDFGPDIAACFPSGRIETLTPLSLLKSWPESGKVLRRSGYEILASSLQIRPGYAKDNPWEKDAILTFSCANSSEKKQGIKKKIIHKTVWDAQLLIGYSYFQKRKENLFFDIHTKKNDKELTSEKTETLDMVLPKMIDYGDTPFWLPLDTYAQGDWVQYKGGIYAARHDIKNDRRLFLLSDWHYLPIQSQALSLSSSPSFFTTKQGYSVFYNLLHRATTKLTWGMRSWTIRLCPSISCIKNLTLDHTVTIQDSRFPDGCITGKITQWCIKASSHTQEIKTELTLSCLSPEAFKKALKFKEKQNRLSSSALYVLPGYVSESYTWQEKKHAFGSALYYERYDDQLAKDERHHLIHDPHSVKSLHIHVDHPACQQEAYLTQLLKDSFSHQDLKDKETRIYINLESMITKECLEESIKPLITGFFIPDV